MDDLIFIDGKEVEWADLNVAIAGVPCGKVLGLSGGVAVEKEFSYGQGDDPQSIQSGNRKPTGTLTVKKGALDNMQDAAIAAGGRDITDVAFEITGSYRAQGVRRLRTITYVACEISEFKEEFNQNDKDMKCPLPFMCMKIVRG